MHTTPHTRSRCERLAARTDGGALLTALSVVPLLALFHPLAPAVALLVLCGRLVGRATEAPTGHGRVRHPA